MRDVIGVDELFEGLFPAELRSVCGRGNQGAAGWAVMVQRQWTTLEWRVFNVCDSGQQFA